MPSGTNLLRDVQFPIRTRHGTLAMTLPEALANPDAQAISSGHPYLDAVANNFLVCVLQTFMAPSTPRFWTDLLDHPPDRSHLVEMLGRGEACFDLTDPHHPFMQVRFEEPTGSQRKDAKRRPEPSPQDTSTDPQDNEPTDGISDITMLLPEETSANQRLAKVGGEHFTKRDRLGELGGFATAMLLCGMNLVGVGGGGGYFNPATKGAALARLAMPPLADAQHALWHSVWFNVMPRTHPALAGLFEYASAPETIFGWMAPGLRRTRGKAPEDKSPAAVANVGFVGIDGAVTPLHPHAFMWRIARRCQLSAPHTGFCSLTGTAGQVWDKVEKQPGGPICSLTERSWHPLIGIRRPDAKGKRSVNVGPPSGIFRALEWSAFFPEIPGGVADREAAGMPPSTAALADGDRRDAINRLLRKAGQTKSPTLPLMGVALRQDKVLEGWSEGTMRLWTGSRTVLAQVASLLAVLQKGAAAARKVIEAAAKAAEQRAPALRSGANARGFRAQMQANMLCAAEALHDDIGSEALDEAALIASDTDEAEGQFDALHLRLSRQMLEACRKVVEGADFTPLGGPLVRAAAILSAERELAACELGLGDNGEQ
jgi:hypothetical protein